jgi:hypothetical protein
LITLLDLLFRRVARTEELVGHLALLELLLRLLEVGDPRLGETDLLEQFLGGLRVVPKVGAMRNLLFFSYKCLFPGNVKDTSLTH